MQPIFNPRTELVQRLRVDRCESCESRDGVPVPHLRKRADLHKKGRARDLYERVLAGRRRKPLVLCRQCHAEVHAGRWDGRNAQGGKGLESRMTSNESRPVWRGADGKGVARLPRWRPTRPL